MPDVDAGALLLVHLPVGPAEGCPALEAEVSVSLLSLLRSRGGGGGRGGRLAAAAVPRMRPGVEEEGLVGVELPLADVAAVVSLVRPGDVVATGGAGGEP